MAHDDETHRYEFQSVNAFEVVRRLRKGKQLTYVSRQRKRLENEMFFRFFCDVVDKHYITVSINNRREYIISTYRKTGNVRTKTSKWTDRSRCSCRWIITRIRLKIYGGKTKSNRNSTGFLNWCFETKIAIAIIVVNLRCMSVDEIILYTRSENDHRPIGNHVAAIRKRFDV